MVKVIDSHLCGWDSIPGKSCSFLIVSLSKGLSLCFLYSGQHVKYWRPREFPLTSSRLLDYHVKPYTHAHTKTYAYHFFEKQYVFKNQQDHKFMILLVLTLALCNYKHIPCSTFKDSIVVGWPTQHRYFGPH